MICKSLEVLRKLCIHYVLEDVAEKVLHKGKDIVTLDKAHLNIKLSKLKLSVASWVFVTIASGDLEIFVETGNHQYLLIKLR